MDPVIRSVVPADVDALSVAFRDWPKQRGLFVGYAERAARGEIDLLVADVDGVVPGYVYVNWTSTYPPFASAGIPYINDFNVIPAMRRHGIGSALLDEAERRVAGRSATVGLGVGLYADYGQAQRMYVKRGYVPDGAGLVVGTASVPAGAQVTVDDNLELKFTKRVR